MNYILSLIFSSLVWQRLAKVLVFTMLALSISACGILGGDDDDDDDAKANSAPTSNAGADQSVAEGTAVTLDGSGSSDSDGSIAKYAWTLTTSNDDVTLSGEDTATASFTAPEVDADTVLVFRLTVTDNDGATATDEVTITVINNIAPTANAGKDQDVNEGLSVSLDGTGSSDSDGTIASYAWTQVGEENLVEIINASSATASFTAPYVSSETTLEFMLTVTDNNGATNQANVKITVVNTTSETPVASAGDDQSVFEGYEVVLDGSGSSDDGVIVSYSWTHAISDYNITLSGADSDIASFIAPELGEGIDAVDMIFSLVVTDDDDDNATDEMLVTIFNSEPSSQVLFASQYELTGNNSEPYAISEEDGEVYSFAQGDFSYTWGLGENPDYMIQRQAYGLQFKHTNAIDENSSFGLVFKAPSNSHVDITRSDTLVIQMGNGANTTDFNASHMIFTVELNGDYGEDSWNNSCSYDQRLYDDSRPLNNEGGTNATWGNTYGIHTYRVGLVDFNCTSGNMSDLSYELEEVVVKVVGDKDVNASATENNEVLLQVGYIGFSNDEAPVPGNGAFKHMLFASQYELIDGAIAEPYAISDEGGEVHGFSDGDFNYSWGLGVADPDNGVEAGDYMRQRQAYGLQFDHADSIDASSFFGLAFKAPNSSALDISGTSVLVIQTGNGAATNTFANSHMVYTLELNGGGNSCSYDLTLRDGSRPASGEGWTNPYGIHTYYVDLSLFTCASGDMGSLASDLEEVVVKVVGGKDATASATSNNQVLLQVGYIAFASGGNIAPIADAGADQSVDEGDSVTLDGSGSSDSDGSIVSYAWELITSNDDVTLTGEDTAAASFTAPSVNVDTDLVFELTVTDDDGVTAADSVTITVNDTNVAPVANAGIDQSVDEGTPVTLDGSGSGDSDGSIASYTWELITSNDDVTLTGADTVTASFTAPPVNANTELVFELTVTDDGGLTATDSVTITVIDSSSGGNVAPVADAGTDQEVNEGATVTLDGSNSSDSDGTIASYAWTHLASNVGVTLSGEDTATASFTAPPVDQETEYAFRLTVTDDDGATATSDTYVTVLDADGSGGDTAEPSSQVLFASQYELIDGATAEPYAISAEDGKVYSFSGGDFFYTWGLGENPDGMIERQAYGLQFNHSGAIDGNSFFGLAFKAPQDSSVDISESDTMVIQTGNGAATDAFANSHMVFTIELNGGSNSCSYDLVLADGSRPGPDQEAWTSPFGIHTYRIALSAFTCASGDMDTLGGGLEEVAVKVVGGKDATASATENNQVLLQVGYIGFSNDTASVPGNGASDYLLFASQYELIDGATQDPYAISEEDGDVYSFSGGDFYYTWGLGENANSLIQRQAYGLQFNHTGAIDGSSYFGLAFQAPDNSALDISATDALIIQTGNGAATDAFANSHMVYTLELNGGGSSCSYDLTLADGSRPGPDKAAWASPFGIHSYYIDLSLFTCASGDMDSLSVDLEEVVVIVVGGKDAIASATEANQVLLQVGYIAFGVYGDLDDGVNVAPTADAGGDDSVDEGDSVTLDGSGSSDSDGSIVSYAWELITSNDDVTLTGADTVTASFTAPPVNVDTELVFELTVTDDDGVTAADSVTITVNDTNVAPVANAGIDQSVDEGTPVTLDGSGSGDSDGSIASYAWTLVTSNDDVVLSGADTATPSFTAPPVNANTELVFELTVTDDGGLTATDSVTITVIDSSSGGNVAPVADAGTDQEVNEGATVTLDGSNSSDSDGTIASYAWTHLASNVGVTLSGEDTATASFTAPPVDQETEYAFRLTVTDDDGATATSDTYVTVLDADGSGGDTAEPSSQVLFASQYELIDGATAEPYAISAEDGKVYSFSGGDFFYTWGLGENPDGMIERQAYGLQFNHSGAIDGNSFFGLAFKAPQDSSVDISESDTMVIQTGNGAATDAFANSHMVFTIELNGGSNSCSYDLVLADGSRPGPDQEAWTSPFGIHTYRIALSAFTCASGDMDTLGGGLEEVAVKVVGGKDATASATENNQVLLQVGYIGFSNDTASVPGNGASDYLLFASQYELIDGATQDPYAISEEDGDVYSFSGGDFYYTWGLGENANSLIQRQAYGLQFNHTGAIDGSSYFGLAFQAPDNSALDISATDALIIQTGNGAATDAFANSHMVYTLELNGGGSSCSYDLTLADGSRPGPDKAAWASPFGIHSYYIDLSLFTCASGDMDSLSVDLEEVVVIVVGGKDAIASATEANQVLLQVGYIAFGVYGDLDDGVNVAPTADAGGDDSVDEGDSVTLDGSGSSDSDGSIVSYAWELITSNDDVTLTGADTVTASFTAPPVNVDTELVFELTVTDDEGATATDSVTITVIDTNVAPTADAGGDDSVDEGASVTLDGSNSGDSDGSIASYTWELITSNDDVTLTGADTVTASFTAPPVNANTELVFELTVTDDGGLTATDSVTITVIDSSSGGNVAPVADAGTDQEVNEGATVTLDGSNSSDSDGTIASYAWTHLTSNVGVTLSGEDTATASFTAPPVDQETEYAFRLTVTDDDGATATSDTYVTVLDADGSGGDTAEPSSQVLFASQYELIDGATAEPYAISAEDGKVYSFSGGDFFYTWGLGENPDGMIERQAYGLQFNHSGAIDGNSFFGLAFKAPQDSSVDISESDTMVIQTGNGAATDAFANSHMVFTIELNGGSNSCSYDLVLADGSRPGPDQEAWTSPFGIHTYRIALSAFTCASGDMDTLGGGLEEVAVKVVGGKDATASATENNQVLLQVGYIGFSNDTASVPGNGASDYLLFASQYELIDGATQDPYAISEEDGDVYSFSGGDFYYTWGLGENANSLIQRQAYGLQFNHTGAIDGSSYFGLAFQAPDNSALDISATDALIIQTGNGAATDAFANSHMVYTLELNGGGSSCSYDLTLADGSRPGPDKAAWASPFGIHSYYIDLSLFTCASGDMDSLSVDLEEVVVMVVGGKDAIASATEANQVLLQVGYIAFGVYGDLDDGVNVAPTADAGGDDSVDEGASVTLDGSKSDDADGSIVSYAWELITSNDDVTLTGADTAKASFTAPSVNADTELVFELTVTDDEGATATDSVTITVIDTNVAPTADAGGDDSVDEGASVTLDGSNSGDSDGSIASYTWELITSNDDVTLTGADTVTASFTAPPVNANTELVFELTVTDDGGLTATDSVTITVIDSSSGGNVAPVADAGTDQEVNEGATVTLDGSNSSDSDGTIASYAWTHLTSNVGVTLSGEDTATASFTAPPVDQETEYAFRLTVTDDDGATATSDTYVTVLDADGSGGDTAEPSSQVLFASQYELIDGATAEPYAISAEDGKVYSFSGGDFFYTWGLGENPDGMIERQAYGLQFNHSGAIDGNSFFGLAFKAPQDSSVDISESDTMVIQTGNGAATDAFANSHMVFTIELNGGSNSCSYDLVLADGSRPGPDQEAWTSPFGIHTYRIALSAFTCASGDMDTLGGGLEEVAVKVVGGKDATASATENNQVLLQVGYIGFSNDTASVPGNGASDYLLFASQYELIDGATQDPYAISEEDGDVYSFSGGDFYYTWGLGENANSLIQRQAYGLQFNHTGAIDGSSYFGLAFQAPDNSALDISATDALIIQTGNGAATDAFANSHMVYTLELNGGGSSCSYDLTLADGSRPGPDKAAWASPFGIHSYYIDLSLFTCASGDMDSLSVDLEEVVVIVVGGKDAIASATEANQVLLQVGYIAFGSYTVATAASAETALIIPDDYSLSWSDEFDSGLTPDTTNWDYDLGSQLIGGTVWGNNEQQHYTSSAANSYIQDGKLIIQAIHEIPADGGEGGDVAEGVIATSARLKTDTDAFYAALGSEPYGFYEVRAKIACVGGSWPAAWMLGRNGDWPGRGEIDIMEWFGVDYPNTTASAAIHNGAYSGGDLDSAPAENPQSGSQEIADLCSEFQNFQLHWLEDQIIIGVDGIVSLTYTKPDESVDNDGDGYDDYWPFDQHAFFILNVAVGGNLGGDVNTNEIADMQLQVEYVKVWQP